jgi:hypothetical protein
VELALLNQHRDDRGRHALGVGADVKLIVDGDPFRLAAATDASRANGRHAISLNDRGGHPRQLEFFRAGRKQRRQIVDGTGRNSAGLVRWTILRDNGLPERWSRQTENRANDASPNEAHRWYRPLKMAH